MNGSLAWSQSFSRYFDELLRRFAHMCFTICFSRGLWLQTDNNVSSLLLNVYGHFAVLRRVKRIDNKQSEKIRKKRLHRNRSKRHSCAYKVLQNFWKKKTDKWRNYTLLLQPTWNRWLSERITYSFINFIFTSQSGIFLISLR